MSTIAAIFVTKFLSDEKEMIWCPVLLALNFMSLDHHGKLLRFKTCSVREIEIEERYRLKAITRRSTERFRKIRLMTLVETVSPN